jgi:VIT1/CCC1 family predicted Fe2+/Mn2+ transporter
MARWKRAVVADELDDKLMELCYEKHLISKQDYRRMSTIIGEALGLTDMVAKKKNKLGIRKRVLANIAAISNETVEAVAAKLQGIKLKEKQTAKAGSLNYLKGRKAA